MMTTCPGCGLILPSDSNDLDELYNASTACRNLCHTLTGYTLSLQDPEFIHQLAVDTYAAQHAGPHVKPISTAFALMGLCLFFDHGYTGRQVQLAHMELANKSKVWLTFSIPSTVATMTIKDVVEAPKSLWQQKLREWGMSVWRNWLPEQTKVHDVLLQFGILP